MAAHPGPASAIKVNPNISPQDELEYFPHLVTDEIP
jgi:hypothetical protein